jgi:hypothetical protein
MLDLVHAFSNDEFAHIVAKQLPGWSRFGVGGTANSLRTVRQENRGSGFGKGKQLDRLTQESPNFLCKGDWGSTSGTKTART